MAEAGHPRDDTATIRTAYLQGVEAAVELIRAPAITRGWYEQSALPGMVVGDLAAHLARSVLLVESFLDDDEPPPVDVIDAGQYFGSMSAQLSDAESELNTGIRKRSRDDAMEGAPALVAKVSGGKDRLDVRVPMVSSARRVTAFGGRPMLIDEYLRTRCVEIAVHLDDLYASIGMPIPPPESTVDVAIGVLMDAARYRHSDLTVLRALTRTERSGVGALRVL